MAASNIGVFRGLRGSSSQNQSVPFTLSIRLELISPSRGVSHTDPSSPLLSVTSVSFRQSEKLHPFLLRKPKNA